MRETDPANDFAVSLMCEVRVLLVLVVLLSLLFVVGGGESAVAVATATASSFPAFPNENSPANTIIVLFYYNYDAIMECD